MNGPIYRWRRRRIDRTARRAEDLVSRSVDQAIAARRDPQIIGAIEAGAYREIEAIELDALRALSRGDTAQAEALRRRSLSLAADVQRTVTAGLGTPGTRRSQGEGRIPAPARARSRV